MREFVTYFILVFSCIVSISWSRNIHRRAVSYIANQTVCIVDSVIYRDGDPIPTDDPCESCKCRPPGFSCVLRECEMKPGCKAIRREGECCPEYQCGCEHNGKFFQDGDRIPNAESPCYTCYCQGSSITCALADCKFRFDCEPEYVPGECCPRYDHCPPEPTQPTKPTTSTMMIPSSTTPEVDLTTATSSPVVEVITASGVLEEDSVTTIVSASSSAAGNDEVLSEDKIEEGTTLSPVSENKEVFVLGSVESTTKSTVDLDDGSLITISSGTEISSSPSPSLVSEVNLVEDSYPTTKDFVPTANLTAEHRGPGVASSGVNLVSGTIETTTTMVGLAGGVASSPSSSTSSGDEVKLSGVVDPVPVADDAFPDEDNLDSSNLVVVTNNHVPPTTTIRPDVMSFGKLL